MKKKSSLIRNFSLLGFFLFLFSGCSSKDVSVQSTKNAHYVLSMNKMIHDCVKEIAGDSISCAVLIDGALDPHSYEVVKGDSDKIAGADIVFCNGLELEHTLSLRKLLEAHPMAVKLGDRLVEAGKCDLLLEEGIKDPHIWLDMSIWKHVPQEIATTLSEVYPDMSEMFFTNAAKLSKRMEDMDQWAKRSMESIPVEKRFLVTGHCAFSYFSRTYLASDSEREDGSWKERFTSPEGVSPEVQISIRDIIRVSDYVYCHNVNVVFPEESLNQDSLEKIVCCLKKKHKVRLSKQPVYSDSVPLNKTYFDMFKHNVSVFTEELGGCVAEF